ncbi:MAG: acyl-CoA reductase [Sandaracinaceae bacterium]
MTVEAAAEGALRDALDELARGGRALRARSRESIAGSLADAWERIADPERALGRAAREQLPESAGLTLPMVAWTLTSTLHDIRAQLGALAAAMGPPAGAREAPPALGTLILAGNVYSACVQPLSVALLSRVPVLVKASSADDVMPRLFAEALEEVDPDLAGACLVVSLPRGTPNLEATILSRAGVVSVYGGDETLKSVRNRLSPNTAFIAHGHGLGLGWVDESASLDDAASSLAIDVAAYDQRGCLSPHAIGGRSPRR